MKDELDEIENLEEGYDLEEKALMMYYIGITQEGIPFNLYEGIEFSETLSEKYKEQNFFYVHYNLRESFVKEAFGILRGHNIVSITEIRKDPIHIFRIIKSSSQVSDKTKEMANDLIKIINKMIKE